MTSNSESEPTSPSTITGINHISLSVSDLDAAVAFYAGAIDVEVGQHTRIGTPAAERASGFNNDPVARATLKGPNGYLELAQYDPALSKSTPEVPVKGPGVTHVCYQSSVEHDIHGRFEEQGASSVTRGGKPVSLLGQGVYYAYSRDRDGIMFETEHLDRPPFSDDLWIAHVALASHDLDRLADFYGMLLGSAPSRRTNKAAGPTFDEVTDYDNVHIRAAWFELSNMVLELWQFVHPVTPDPGEPTPLERIGYNKFTFEVTDLQHDYDRLLAAGVELLSKPVTSDEGTEVYGRDPDGNLFSLFEPAPDSAHSLRELKMKSW